MGIKLKIAGLTLLGVVLGGSLGIGSSQLVQRPEHETYNGKRDSYDPIFRSLESVSDRLTEMKKVTTFGVGGGLAGGLIGAAAYPLYRCLKRNSNPETNS